MRTSTCKLTLALLPISLLLAGCAELLPLCGNGFAMLVTLAIFVATLSLSRGPSSSV